MHNELTDSNFALADSGSGISVGIIVGIVLGVTAFFSVLVAFLLYYKRKQFSFLDIFSNKQEEFDGKCSNFGFLAILWL